MQNSPKPKTSIWRSPLGFEIPPALRALVRARESGLIVLAALIGAIAGLVVAAMSFSVTMLHAMLFGVERGGRLSAMPHIDPGLPSEFQRPAA